MSDMIEIARGLAPAIRAEAAQMEALRRMPDSLAHRFAEAGVYRLCVPRDLGGLETSARTLVETIEALSMAEASAGWCAMIGATTGVLAAYLPRGEAETVFGDPMSIVCGVYAPMGRAEAEDDWFRVNGQWKWNSGGQNATWLVGGCMIFENGAPRTLPNGVPAHRMVFFPASDVSFIDTWRTAGLNGTGSGDMKVSDVRAPQARSASLITDKPREAGKLYAFPAFGLLSIGIAAVTCGNARAALEEFKALAKQKKAAGSSRALAERGVTQALYAECTARLLSARAFLLDAIDTAWAQAEPRTPMSLERRAHLRLAASHVSRTGADVIRQLQDQAGGAGVFLSDPLQRRLRDAQTATAHMMIAPSTYELAGRVLLDQPTAVHEL